jgi:hypothetical protein
MSILIKIVDNKIKENDFKWYNMIL